MYDKDDDNFNIDDDKDINVEPYDLDAGFSSPYDSIADLEKMVEEDLSADDNQPEPISQFNMPKKKNESNMVFVATILALLLIIGGGVFALYSGIIEIPSSISAFINKPAAKETAQQEKVARDVDISVATDEDFNKMMEADNNPAENLGQDEVLPDLPPTQDPAKEMLTKDAIGGRIPNGSTGRLDPFNPGGTNDFFDVMAPPTNATPDTEAQKLLAIKITGIMYSAGSPSALVNIGGSDQLVRQGDSVDGFHIDKITNKKVTVRHGKNVYTASVGELVDMSNVTFNNVPNMSRKFAGPYSGKGRMIEIKTY